MRDPSAMERVALADAAGRVLADPRIVAAVDVPPFANSSMDGFALRAIRCARCPSRRGRDRRRRGNAPFGRGRHGGSHHDRRPAAARRRRRGADRGCCRVRRRRLRALARRGRQRSCARPRTTPEPGTKSCSRVRSRRPGWPCSPPWASARSSVRRRPVVAILSTGDELVAPGDPLRPGQIHDANGPALAAAVTDAGGEPRLLERVGDDPEAIERVLRTAAGSADLIVTSGGVSVGRHDHVRSILEQRGSLDFWRIAVQPGKPLAVGELDGTHDHRPARQSGQRARHVRALRAAVHPGDARAHRRRTPAGASQGLGSDPEGWRPPSLPARRPQRDR